MKKCCIVALLLLSQSVFADGYLTPYGDGVNISKIFMHPEGGATLWVSGISNPDNCSDTSMVHLRPGTAGYKDMLSVVMMAYASGKKLGFWSQIGCAALPFWGGPATRPIIHTLWITD